jgi:hypothetical protein
LDIRVGGETITATPEHPFWVVGRGWATAGELLPGYELLTAVDAGQYTGQENDRTGGSCLKTARNMAKSQGYFLRKNEAEYELQQLGEG